MGAYLIYDQISKEKYVPDRDRIAMLLHLVADGYGDSLMLGGDFGRASYWTSNGGAPRTVLHSLAICPLAHFRGDVERSGTCHARK